MQLIELNMDGNGTRFIQPIIHRGGAHNGIPGLEIFAQELLETGSIGRDEFGRLQHLRRNLSDLDGTIPADKIQRKNNNPLYRRGTERFVEP